MVMPPAKPTTAAARRSSTRAARPEIAASGRRTAVLTDTAGRRAARTASGVGRLVTTAMGHGSSARATGTVAGARSLLVEGVRIAGLVAAAVKLAI
jgi:hypothetical protein